MREAELTRPARQGEPGGLPGQPQRYRDPAGSSGPSNREGLGAPLRVIATGRHLDEQGLSTCGSRQVVCGHGSRLPDVLDLVYTGLLIAACVLATLAGAWVVVSLFRGQA